MWSLVTSGGRRLPLASLPAIVGRHPSADIVIDHGSIAPHHARLTLADDGSLFIEALDEALIEVAGWRVEQGVLNHGDELLLGVVTLRLLDDSASAGPRSGEAGGASALAGGGQSGSAALQAGESPDSGLQLRQPARSPAQGPTRPTAHRRRTTVPLRVQRPASRHGMLHAEFSQLGWLQKVAIVAGLVLISAGVVWGLAVLIPAAMG